MRHPWVNVVLLVLLALELATGFLGLVEGRPERGWWTWLHGVGGFAIVSILFWKGVVILNAYRRGLEWSVRRWAFLVTTALFLATLITGIVWTFDGPIYWLGFSLLTVHILLAVGSLGLLAWHSWYMRFILRHPDSRGRRTLLRLGAALMGGLVVAGLADLVRGALDVAGAQRRFTGSYETGSHGGSFPVVAWIADRPPTVDLNTWRLEVRGAVNRPFQLSHEELVALGNECLPATLDCTGGWYTHQEWEGVRLDRILDMAGLSADARSVTVQSLTGYRRRYPLDEAAGFLLALRVAGRPLSRGHGFPLRLVAPGRRGFDWVKWVAHLKVNRSGPAWQSPLPLQ